MKTSGTTLTGSALALIACAAMVLDHCGLVLCHGSSWELPMRTFGRMAFVLFAFLLVEGLLHTRDTWMYTLRLLLLALLSEIPFDLAFGGTVAEPSLQNTVFTLALCAAVLSFIRTNPLTDTVGREGLNAAALFAGALLCRWLNLDGYPTYYVTAMLMYFLRREPAARALTVTLTSALPLGAVLAFVPISLYNGQRGARTRGLWKWALYGFYPIHLILLYLLKNL